MEAGGHGGHVHALPAVSTAYRIPGRSAGLMVAGVMLCRRMEAAGMVATAHGLMVAHALPVAGMMLCPVMDAPG